MAKGSQAPARPSEKEPEVEVHWAGQGQGADQPRTGEKHTRRAEWLGQLCGARPAVRSL